MHIYHITSQVEWENQIPAGRYVPANYPSDGFIHCSTANQVRSVAQRLYEGLDHLVALEIETALLEKQPIFENLEGGKELYPHLYGPLPTTAVTRVINLPLDSRQKLQFPLIFPSK